MDILSWCFIHVTTLQIKYANGKNKKSVWECSFYSLTFLPLFLLERGKKATSGNERRRMSNFRITGKWKVAEAGPMAEITSQLL